MLTGPGRSLVDSGSRLLADLEEIEVSLHREAGSVTGRLRIAAFATAMRGIVAPALQRTHADHPGLSVTLAEREPWETVALVASGQADLGVVHSWGDVALAVPEHLTTAHVADDVADVIVPVHHRLATRRRVSPRDLVEEDWIATPEGTICRQWLQRFAAGRPPDTALDQERGWL